MATMRAQQEALKELWQQGLSGHELLTRHTALVDAYIVDHYEKNPAMKRCKGEVAVIALGGYGRKELYPYSDIDLLLLYDRKSKKVIKEVAEAILYPLWDSGFEVGHSVRSVKDAVNFSRDDFFFQVALLDARLLAGSHELYEDLLALYKKKVINGRREEFVKTMDAFRADRRENFGSHAYLLEPHIKEGKGGMRDIQAMLWVAKGVFGLPDLEAITASGMLDEEEAAEFKESWNMLVRVRNRLHYTRQRKNDQLIFEFQEEMAAAFDYSDQGGLLSVEHFMRDVYRHLQTVAVVTDLFFDHVHEVLGLVDDAAVDQQLEEHIIIRKGTLRLVQVNSLEERPYLLMRIFLLSGRIGLPLHHRSKKRISQSLDLVDDDYRHSRRVARFFIKLLIQTRKPFPVLESMLATGFLTSYLPEFAAIESLAQHDLYHLYTVDRHQLQAVQELALLREEEGDLFAEIEEGLPVLYLAALLHDIGKGRQVDHSELGAEMILAIGKRLHLDKKEQETLSFLVRYHLYLPENAMRRDLEDHAFIQQTAKLIGSEQRLTMLYLLTIADSKATGPSAWSSWKSRLLTDLYLKVKACLSEKCHLDSSLAKVKEQSVQWLREQVHSQVAVEGSLRMGVDQLPPDYLIAFTPEEVALHLTLHRDKADRLHQQVMLFPEPGPPWSLLVMSRNRVGLLAKLCGVLALHNLTVLSAQIFTWSDDTVVDVLELSSVVDRDFEEQSWQELAADVNRAINYRLDVGYQLHHKLHPLGVGSRRMIQQPECKVVVDNETSQSFTIIEVHGGDSYASLYHLTQTIADFNLDIHRARIATEVEQLIDVFYITTSSGNKLEDEQFIEKVRMTLLQIISTEGVSEEEV